MLSRLSLTSCNTVGNEPSEECQSHQRETNGDEQLESSSSNFPIAHAGSTALAIFAKREDAAAEDRLAVVSIYSLKEHSLEAYTYSYKRPWQKDESEHGDNVH